MSAESPNPSPAPGPGRKALAFLRLLLRPAVARKLGTLATVGYLAETGWVRSVQHHEIADVTGSPIPWTTFPFIDFISPRLKQTWSVFEFGAGASTRFYARHVAQVVAVEHDETFASTLRPLLPAHARVLCHPSGSPAYADAVNTEGAPWDLVSVDGVDRVACVAAALPHLQPSGVLVLDDSERVEYLPALTTLRAAGFRAVEFWGLAPGRIERKCTSIFYRSENVLDL